MHAAVHTGASAAGGTREWLASAGLVALTVVAWQLRHPYEGITHDAQLYSFQAMARLKPELLGNDLFLRFGSQDNYTIFSSLYAALMAHIGFEPAAALLTFLSQAAFLLSAGLLARRVMSRELAWLSVGVLVAVPGVYGAQGTWNLMEGFVTPRLACEALVLAALAATIAQRHWIAAACIAAGSLLHPLMAAAGVALVLYVHFMPVRPRVLVAVCVAAVVLTAAAALFIPAESALRMEGDSLALVQERQSFLFVTLWRTTDWGRAAVHLTTLLIGVITLEPGSAARKLCAGAIVVALGGVLASGIGGDLLHIELAIQAQPWRCLWVATVLAALLLPTIAQNCWNRGTMGKVVVILVAITWLAIDEPYTIIVAPLAIIASATVIHSRLPAESTQRMLLAGCSLLALIVVIRSIANNGLFASEIMDQTRVPPLVREIRAYCADGMLPCAVFFGMWWVITSARAQAARATAALACLAAGLALTPAVASEWQRVQFPQRDFDAFAAWRSHIPPGAEVLWIDGPVATWALLERPRYLTSNQMASFLFSHAARRELRERARRLAPFAEQDPYIFWEQDRALVRKGLRPALADLCGAIDADYIVTRRDLAPEPLAPTPPGASLPYRGLKLFRCAR